MEQFLYIISHDLKQPLVNISAFANLYIRKYSSSIDTIGEGFLKIVIDNSTHLQNLTNDLLSYFGLSSNNSKKELIELDQIVDQAKSNLKKLIEEQSIVFQLQSNGKVFVFKSLFIQVIQNLLSNGIKYNSSEQKLISINHKIEEGSSILKIRDNGMGVDVLGNRHLFEIFKRGTNSATISGNGMGLAICEKIVSFHSGEIRINENFKHGTEFIIKIPNA